MRLPDLVGGKWALVTGASSGIGEEFARQLGAAGANLVLTARREGRLRERAAEIERAHGVAVRVVTADLARPGGADALGDGVEALGVPIDLLVNNAGMGVAGQFAASDPARTAELLRLNCEAPTLLARRFLPAMIARRRGGIVNVGSLAGYQPTPYMASYGASKAYLQSFSLALAQEVRPHGVRVTLLCPGPVHTGFQAAAGTELPGGALGLAITEVAANVRAALQAYSAGRTVALTGTVNQLVAMTVRLLPLRLVARVSGRVMRETGRAG